MEEMLADQQLAELTTFAVPARARYFVRVETREALIEAIRESRRLELPWLLLGGGSNILFTRDFPGVVIHLDNRGIHPEQSSLHYGNGTGGNGLCGNGLARDSNENTIRVHAAAGENWHALVRTCLENGWHGLENLALIPGRVGAAPVQNIGAYGVELSDRLASLTMLDTDTLSTHCLEAADCEFGYRDSVFKHRLRERAVILSVTLKLFAAERVHIGYQSLKAHFQERGLEEPAPTDVFEAVCAIRRARLPDPGEIGNAGSFFKNPVVERATHDRLLEAYPELPGHVTTVAGREQIKLPAAWLIEHAGWKGHRRGAAGVSERQALVLVNHGGATGGELLALARDIAASVHERFGLRLQPEVRIEPDGWPDPVAAGETVAE